jgi:hypothetical protein
MKWLQSGVSQYSQLGVSSSILVPTREHRYYRDGLGGTGGQRFLREAKPSTFLVILMGVSGDHTLKNLVLYRVTNVVICKMKRMAFKTHFSEGKIKTT